jgi:cobalt/nickel transport protein
VKKTWLFAAAGLALAFALAWFVAPHASDRPDGLDRVVKDSGHPEADPAWNKAPAPAYRFPWIGDGKRSTAVAGIAGTVVVFVAGCGLAWLLSRRKAAAKGGA